MAPHRKTLARNRRARSQHIGTTTTTSRNVASDFPRSSVAFAISCALASGAAPVAAADCTWSTASSDFWTTDTAWSNCAAAIPNAPTDTALIAAEGTDYTVTLDSDIELDSLTVDSPNAVVAHTSGALTFNSMSIVQGTYDLNGGRLVELCSRRGRTVFASTASSMCSTG